MKSNHASRRSIWLWLCLLGTAFATTAAAWQMKQAPLMTRWAALVDTNAPWPEYPRPQLVRSDWLNLNGLWQFQPGATNDPVPFGQNLTNTILVPYPMESAISGVKQYSPFSWYRRTFTVPSAWNGRRTILHLDAVNWRATVYVNGTQIGVHKGGYDSFSYDLTPYLNGGTNELIVQDYSPMDAGGQPRGKLTLYPGGIMYTSASGIWQPVWLEPVDATGVHDVRIVPDVDNSRLRLTVNTYATNGVTILATALTNGIAVGSVTGAPLGQMELPIPDPILWTPENPFLYDLQITVLHNGLTSETVTSYFGMRKISVKVVNGTPQMYLNNQPHFEMGPLDQGFWPDGIYTAPTDDALKYDLEQTKALGFNMVRKHIKVEPQRWYYWADKLGLLVWQDMPSCNSYSGNPSLPPVDPNQFSLELTNMVKTHWNSPAIIMWDIFNEAQGQEGTSGGVGQASTAYLVQLVKTLDPSRLVNQASGGDYHGVGDVLDNHSYPAPGNPGSSTQVPVDGEYGGIGFQIPGHLWNPALAGGNYVGANSTNDIALIYDTFSTGLVYAKSTGGLNAAVYTQITDVENECNGLLTYDRILKPALNLIRASNEKAISARMYLSTVLPSSQNQPRFWKYTTAMPPANWHATNFNDSGWNSGPGGFGTSFTPGSVVGTTWNTSDIWLRQSFTVGALNPADRTKLAFYLYHDEDCEIYLNGMLAGSTTGYAITYVTIPVNAAGQAALIANGTNVIAVHCHNTTGGQDIDVGIVKQVLAMNAFVVPTDTLGYWALDDGAGATAGDSSGNGNNGVVNGAVWSGAGKVQGCLNFNGVNSYAQVNNSVGKDFSISFWMKTTQAGGTGQWWQGRGLVDGFVGAGTNDFGVSLCGSHIAFGTGNPDTTILSAASVNNATWHQCVATREQSTGAMKIYVDGVLQATGTGGTNTLADAAHLRFGARQTGVTNFFNGSLDDIRLYNRALGSNEVAALFADSASPPAAPDDLTASAGNHAVSLAWSSLPGVAGYDVKRSTQPGGPYTSIANLADTSHLDQMVSNGVTYYYVVAGINSLGDGADSPEASATPSLAAALKTWFAADALAGLANGAPVAEWPDASGNEYHAIQPAPALQPVYTANALNGLPVVRFNAASSNSLAFPRPVQDDFTIFCVFRSSQGYGSGSLFYQGAGLVNGESPNQTSDFGSCLFANGKVCAGTGDPDVAVNSAAGFNDGLPHLMTFQRTETSGRTDLYLDGVFVGNATGRTTSLTAPAQLVLGAQQTLTYFLTGDIAEVKIFNSALAVADRVHEENALIYKWGIRPLPALSLAAATQTLTLSWPVSAAGWSLWFATNLASAVWLPFTDTIASNAGHFSISVPSNSGSRFFRLSAP